MAILSYPFRRPNRSLDADIASISALNDPIRSAVLMYVTRSGGETSRDQVAAAMGVSRRVAAFHLDRLANEGWLEVGYRRLTGRTGPGAGRSSKLYRRSSKRVDVSIPARNYELMARALGSGIQYGRASPSSHDIEAGARGFGVAVGAQAKAAAGRADRRRAPVRALFDKLAALGFEPFADPDGMVRLRNCPYHDMARENSELVCAVNLALLEGVVQGLDLKGVEARLEPHEGQCCVAFRMRGH